MIALEDAIIKDLPHNDIIKFYVRYVDDTLVLAKPSEIYLILNKLNSYQPDIQFTHEEFIDKNDVHFLDIKLTSHGTTTIFRKKPNTGQYIHLSSFTPWSYKIAWTRSPVSRAQKICSNKTLVLDEINTALKFISWNRFSKRLVTKLIKQITPNYYNNNDN